MDRNLLSNATSADDSPTPGYMLNEIARSTLSTYEVNTQLQLYLISRIAKNNHNIKFKCLVIIKHVCRSGRPEFKKEMAKHVEPIKECLQYKGPPDPLRGDEIYKRVREAAREALDAVFDGQQSVITSTVAAGGRIVGTGNNYEPSESHHKSGGSGPGYMSQVLAGVSSAVLGDGMDAAYAGHPGATGTFNAPSAYGGNAFGPSFGSGYSGSSGGGGGGGSGGYPSSSGMAGLGNQNFKDSREEKSWSQKATDLAKTAANMYNGTSGPGVPTSNGRSDYNFTSNRGDNAYNSNQQTYSTPQQPRNALGGGGRDQYNGASSYGGGMVPDIPYGQPGMGRAGGAASDGAYEQSLIETLCEPGGLKPVPSEEKLAAFLAASATLSVDTVGSCLLDALNSESWQSRVKALIVIAQLVKVRESAKTHARWWAEHTEDVQALLSDSKAAVRTQTSKTLRAIGADGGSASAGASSISSTSTGGATAQSATHGKEVNLLGEYDDDISGSSNYASPPVQQLQHQHSTPVYNSPAADDSSSMFAGMSLSEKAAPPVPPTHTQQFTQPAATTPALPAAAAPAVQPTTTTAIGEHFNFLDDYDAPLPPTHSSNGSNNNSQAAPAPWGATPPVTPQHLQQQQQQYSPHHQSAPPQLQQPDQGGDLFASMDLLSVEQPAPAVSTFRQQQPSPMPPYSGSTPGSGANSGVVSGSGGNTSSYANELSELNMTYSTLSLRNGPGAPPMIMNAHGSSMMGGVRPTMLPPMHVAPPQQQQQQQYQPQQQQGFNLSQHQPHQQSVAHQHQAFGQPHGQYNQQQQPQQHQEQQQFRQQGQGMPLQGNGVAPGGGGSVFSFLGGAAPGNGGGPIGSPGKHMHGGKGAQHAPVNDSFSFVSEQMKALNKK